MADPLHQHSWGLGTSGSAVHPRTLSTSALIIIMLAAFAALLWERTGEWDVSQAIIDRQAGGYGQPLVLAFDGGDYEEEVRLLPPDRLILLGYEPASPGFILNSIQHGNILPDGYLLSREVRPSGKEFQFEGRLVREQELVITAIRMDGTPKKEYVPLVSTSEALCVRIWRRVAFANRRDGRKFSKDPPPDPQILADAKPSPEAPLAEIPEF